jgi:SAM-dependent methyltransferase
VFKEPAELYDAIYFVFKDYADEARQIAALLHEIHPNAHTILDVACGTGEHARQLSTMHGYQVDGIDLNADFLRLARIKNPNGQFVHADMADFHLGKRYDAVICMFSSIGYLKTLDQVTAAFRCFREHLADGGVVIVEPWFAPGVMTSGQHSHRSAGASSIQVERIGNTEIVDRICRLTFEYTIHDGNDVRHSTELHELGLFTVQEQLEAFAAAGLSARHQSESPSKRGVFLARAQP